MISVPRESIMLGLDVHKCTIGAGILAHETDVPCVDQLSSDPESVRRLIGRFSDPRGLAARYEAGPTGYELARQLPAMGVCCEVVACGCRESHRPSSGDDPILVDNAR